MKISENVRDNIILAIALTAALTGLAMWDRESCNCCNEQLSPEQISQLLNKFEPKEAKNGQKKLD